jgi:hypothetical protein
MKKSILFCLLFCLVGCNQTVEKPKNLIAKDKMIEILYDISLLEAIKTQNINGGIRNKTANEYLYKKYQVDSVQLAQSNKYYAADVEEYKKMFEEVKKRLETQTNKIGGKTGLGNSPTTSETPLIQ